MLKVSIIIPVFNTEKYIDKCMESLINQTYKNIEIILVNDGSTDNSLSIIEKYKMKDNRIKIFSQENQGIYKARDTGIENVTGDYVMFIDSDDWIDTNTIESLVDIINEYNCDIVKYKMILEPSRKISELGIMVDELIVFDEDNKKELYDIITESNSLNNLANQIVKRNLLNKLNYSRNLSQGEDIARNLDIYTNAKKIVLIPNYFYHYRTNLNSTTHILNKDRIIKNLEDILFLYEIRIEYLKKWNFYEDKSLKIIGLRLLNFITAGVLRKLYLIKDVKHSDLKEIYNMIYNNKTFDFLMNYVTMDDIKDKNIILKNIKKLILLKNDKIDYKYRTPIRLYFKIKH